MLNNLFFCHLFCTSPENCRLVTSAVWGRRSRMRVRSTSVRWMWRCQRGGASIKALSSRSMRMTLTGLNRWACSLDVNAVFHLSHILLSWLHTVVSPDGGLRGNSQTDWGLLWGHSEPDGKAQRLEPYSAPWMLLDVHFSLCCSPEHAERRRAVQRGLKFAKSQRNGRRLHCMRDRHRRETQSCCEMNSVPTLRHHTHRLIATNPMTMPTFLPIRLRITSRWFYLQF